MRHGQFVVFFLYAVLLAAFADGSQINQKNITEIVTGSDPLPSSSTEEYISKKSNEEITRTIEDTSNATVQERKDSSRTIEDASKEKENHLSEEMLSDLPKNITGITNSASKRQIINLEKSLPVDRLKAYSCEAEARRSGHGYESAVMIQEIMCESRKLWGYVLIIGRNLKAELNIEPQFIGQGKFKFIDSLLSGALFDFMESSLLELEIFLRHPENLENLMETIKGCIPTPEIGESLKRIVIGMQNLINHIRGLKSQINPHEKKEDVPVLKDLKKEILTEIESILNFIHGTLPDRVEKNKNILSKISSIIDYMFDKIFLEKSPRKIIDTVIPIFEGYRPALIGRGRGLILRIIVNLLSNILGIPLEQQYGGDSFSIPSEPSFPYYPGVPGVMCACRKTGPTYPSSTKCTDASIPPFTTINSGTPSRHPFNIISGRPSTVDSSLESIENSSGRKETTSAPRSTDNVDDLHTLPMFNNRLTTEPTTVPEISPESSTEVSRSTHSFSSTFKDNREDRSIETRSYSEPNDSSTSEDDGSEGTTVEKELNSESFKSETPSMITDNLSPSTEMKDQASISPVSIYTHGRDLLTTQTPTKSEPFPELLAFNLMPSAEMKDPASISPVSIYTHGRDLLTTQTPTKSEPFPELLAFNLMPSAEMKDPASISPVPIYTHMKDLLTTQTPTKSEPFPELLAFNLMPSAEMKDQASISPVPIYTHMKDLLTTQTPTKSEPFPEMLAFNLMPSAESKDPASISPVPIYTHGRDLLTTQTPTKSEPFPELLAFNLMPSAEMKDPASISPVSIYTHGRDLLTTQTPTKSEPLPKSLASNEEPLVSDKTPSNPSDSLLPPSNVQPANEPVCEQYINPSGNTDTLYKDYPRHGGPTLAKSLNIFEKMLELLIRSSARSSTPITCPDVCGTSVSLPAFSSLNDILINAKLSQLSLRLSKEELASVLGNGVLIAGDTVTIFLKNGVGLIGHVTEHGNWINFNPFKETLTPACYQKGVTIWHVRMNDLRNRACANKLRIFTGGY